MPTRTGLRAVALSLMVFSGCVSSPPLDSARMSPLQIRAIQTRTYEEDGDKGTLKTVLNVLQDDGFVIDYGNVELGLLHGTKEIDALAAQAFGTAPAQLEHTWISTLNRFGPMVEIVTIEATANVTELDKQTRVRVSFHRKLTNNWAGTTHSMAITDAKYYQEFFAKLERGLFIERQGL